MKTQQLNDEQEQMRLEGLRILARIIVRHYLAHPERYADVPARDPGGPQGDSHPSGDQGPGGTTGATRLPG